MDKMLKAIVILFIVIFSCLQAFTQGQEPTKEYFKYKKEADFLFDKGDYKNARRNYALCLSENERDIYAKERLDQSKKCIDLIEKAKALSLENKKEEAIPILMEVLKINPKDKAIQAKHYEYWSLKPLTLFEQGEYEASKLLFEESKNFPYTCDVCVQKLKIIDKYEKAIVKSDSALSDTNWSVAISGYNEAKKHNPICKTCDFGINLAKSGKKTEDSLDRIKQKTFISFWTLGSKFKERGMWYEYSDYPRYTAYMCNAINQYNIALSIAEDCKICNSQNGLKINEIKNTYIVECEGYEKAEKELKRGKIGTFTLGLISTSLAIFYANKYKKEGLSYQKTTRNVSIGAGCMFFGLRILIGQSKPEKLNCNLK